MKEYKVINWKSGLNNNNQRLEDCLNDYGKQGYKLKYTDFQTHRLIFERDKNL